MAKRQEIAAGIRKDAVVLAKPVPQMLRLLESLIYYKDAAAQQQAVDLAQQYVASLRQLPANQLSSRKDEVKRVDSAFQYLARNGLMAPDFGPKVEIQKLIKEQRWDKK